MKIEELKLITYPISVKRSNYRGSDRRKCEKALETNRVAALLEKYINEKLKKQKAPIQWYLYYEIAEETGIPIEEVSDLCFSIDCGHNGFTAIKTGLTFEQAMVMNERGE